MTPLELCGAILCCKSETELNHVLGGTDNMNDDIKEDLINHIASVGEDDWYVSEFNAEKIKEKEEKGHMAWIEERTTKKVIEKGMKQGLEQGTEKEKLEIAKKLLRKEFSIKDIIDITGIDINTINNLKNNN